MGADRRGDRPRRAHLRGLVQHCVGQHDHPDGDGGRGYARGEPDPPRARRRARRELRVHAACLHAAQRHRLRIRAGAAQRDDHIGNLAGRYGRHPHLGGPEDHLPAGGGDVTPSACLLAPGRYTMKYTSATISPPPTILPSVTGTRLPTIPATGRSAASTRPGRPWATSRAPTEKKYMFATLCSKPAATNAEMGNTMAMILSVTLRPAMAIHTARHTRMLHKIPLKNASQNGREAFATAILTA